MYQKIIYVAIAIMVFDETSGKSGTATVVRGEPQQYIDVTAKD